MKLGKIFCFLCIFILCACSFVVKQNPNAQITYFSYSFGSYHSGYEEYFVYTKNDKVYFTALFNLNYENNIEDVEIDEKYLNDLTKIINRPEVLQWDKFNKTDSSVLDGSSFDFQVKFDDKKEINASGYMKYPKNYKEISPEIKDILEELVKEYGNQH